jgi:hypothetical protein
VQTKKQVLPYTLSGIKLNIYTAISIKEYLFLWCLAILGQQSSARIYAQALTEFMRTKRVAKFLVGEMVTDACMQVLGPGHVKERSLCWQ